MPNNDNTTWRRTHTHTLLKSTSYYGFLVKRSVQQTTNPCISWEISAHLPEVGIVYYSLVFLVYKRAGLGGGLLQKGGLGSKSKHLMALWRWRHGRLWPLSRKRRRFGLCWAKGILPTTPCVGMVAVAGAGMLPRQPLASHSGRRNAILQNTPPSCLVPCSSLQQQQQYPTQSPTCTPLHIVCELSRPFNGCLQGHSAVTHLLNNCLHSFFFLYRYIFNRSRFQKQKTIWCQTVFFIESFEQLSSWVPL